MTPKSHHSSMLVRMITTSLLFKRPPPQGHVLSYSCILRQFGGYAKEADYIAHATQLRAALEGKATCRGDVYFCTGYDPPMKPYGRRNEVWLVKT